MIDSPGVSKAYSKLCFLQKVFHENPPNKPHRKEMIYTLHNGNLK